MSEGKLCSLSAHFWVLTHASMPQIGKSADQKKKFLNHSLNDAERNAKLGILNELGDG
jgi:hypothetical protein